MRTKITHVGVALVSLAVILVACNSQGNVTATPAGAAAAGTAPAACTPTPAVPAPTYTIGPSERSTPAIQLTKVTQYQAAYPGNVIIPTQTTDLYPQIPADKKEKLVVRHQNCTYDGYLLPSTAIAGFRNSLPGGDVIVGEIDPPSQLGAYILAPNVPTPNPSQLPGTGSKVPGIAGSPPVPVPSPPPPAFQTEAAQFSHTIATAAASATNAALKP